MTRDEIITLYKQQGTGWPLLLAQAYCESRLNPNAVSPAGARGIAQFMPATWAECVQRGWAPDGSTPDDPRAAIPAHAAYMRWLLRRFAGARRPALAAYNWGIGRVQEAMRSKNWEDRVPRETYAYVRQVLVLSEWIAETDTA